MTEQPCIIRPPSPKAKGTAGQSWAAERPWHTSLGRRHCHQPDGIRNSAALHTGTRRSQRVPRRRYDLERLRNNPTSKVIPATRWSFIAWEDTHHHMGAAGLGHLTQQRVERDGSGVVLTPCAICFCPIKRPGYRSYHTCVPQR